MANIRKSRFLTIAGSDCSCGAGIQADIRTASLFDFYPCSVITAVTSQNTTGVSSVFKLPHQVVFSQFDAVISDMRPDCVKIGMLWDPELIRKIASRLKESEIENIVVDPVLSFTLQKDEILKKETVESLVNYLFPLASLITPNLIEAAVIEEITGSPVQKLCKATLLKGGHSKGEFLVDRLYYRERNRIIQKEFEHKKIETTNLHGTGCVLSSAIACLLVSKKSLPEAIESAINFLYASLNYSKSFKMGQGKYGPCLVPSVCNLI